MSRSNRTRQRWLLASATIFVAASGCSDSSLLAPTTASRAGNPNAGGGQRRLSIVALNLTSSSLVIGGARVGYSVTVENKGQSVSNVVLQGAIVQGSVSQPAGGFSASCVPSQPGVVPKGSCQMTFTAGASNANGGGTLVPGPASFVLTMSLSAGGVSTVLDQASVPVTLVAPITRSISSLSFPKTTLNIADAATLQADIANFTAVLQNTGSALSNVRLQTDFVQGTVVHNSGSLYLTCNDPQNGDGILPNGSCTMNWFAVAGNVAGSGPGTLVSGAATFVLKLIQDVNGTPTVLDSRSVAVTLVGRVAITDLALSSTTLAIGGAGVPYDVTIANATSQLNDVFIQGEMLQNGNVAGAAGSNLLCPPTSANAVLPVGTCTMPWVAVAGNQSYNPAPLVPGAATFRLTLYQSQGPNSPPLVLDTKSVAVTLVAGPPEVTSVIFVPSSDVLLSTTVATNYNVTLINSGSAMSGMTLRGRVEQTLNGSTSIRNVSDVPVTCPSNASGTLPNGVCTFQVTTFVSNSAPGSGPDLQPENDATYVVTLYQNGVEVASTSRIVHLKVQLF